MIFIFCHLLISQVNSSLMAQIFVYGTLKKGQPNHRHIIDKSNGKAEFVATAVTTQRYPLVIASKYNVPFLLNLPGLGQRVQGEIYKVDEQMLRFLDDFECVPTRYQRTPVELEVKEVVGGTDSQGVSPGSVIEAFIYSTTTYQPDWPSLPTYSNYDSLGAHGLIYVCKEDRD